MGWAVKMPASQFGVRTSPTLSFPFGRQHSVLKSSAVLLFSLLFSRVLTTGVV